MLRGCLAGAQKLNDILLAPRTIDERAQLLGLLLRVYRAHNPDWVPAGFVARLEAVKPAGP